MNQFVVRALSQIDWLTVLDVAESRTGPGRFNADGDKLAGLLGRVSSERQCVLKCLPICNYVIGWKNDHDRSMIAHSHPPCAECDCRGGVAFGRLGHDVLLWKISEQLSNCALLFRIDKNQNLLARDKPIETRKSLFQSSFLRDAALQLLRPRS